ncbi:hypothetical protein BVC80_7269g1 [Macleaya cordata]|uniref:NAD-dependent epimerase/dehydratase n=1 Tax=Macleaya cordata TaxID=56857 RepID=A0A200QMF5_MACCD|nr:hypothetical protein BVC80_7269g1 [Macleaya cordata]
MESHSQECDSKLVFGSQNQAGITFPGIFNNGSAKSSKFSAVTSDHQQLHHPTSTVTIIFPPSPPPPHSTVSTPLHCLHHLHHHHYNEMREIRERENLRKKWPASTTRIDLDGNLIKLLTICMIGAGGFIGSHLCEKLMAETPQDQTPFGAYNSSLGSSDPVSPLMKLQRNRDDLNDG